MQHAESKRRQWAVGSGQWAVGGGEIKSDMLYLLNSVSYICYNTACLLSIRQLTYGTNAIIISISTLRVSMRP